ncbi:tryptophan 7-halogenase [Erythrobacter sp. LQ02-29]|uniref:tryptophan halogenase family protein n=1 Tax=Erythrobacter sp. LQ02-29 TaxID=2920384 RepID=UPI001F4E9D85|nr:tryptophan halogenase family protein [Erythrobacter sp. LQ02-29]MCP9221386.1 tryptophan 7-halogenase [Erythrobacter sp. LQ02-29]
MARSIRQIVIVGGGTAGWLAACRIAAHLWREAAPVVTLVEAPDIAPLGVGEGTWPTMRGTLARIGIGEAEFLRACDGSFKQGSRFDGWVTGAPDDTYLHPFTAPPEGVADDVLAGWSAVPDRSFAEAMTAQARICRLDCAPRQPGMPDYAGALNYAYHLDAGKLATMLRQRAVDVLGVRHVRDRVTDVVPDASGGISRVETKANGPIEGDMFIDCTGRSARLIGDALQVPWIDRSEILFNDRALAVQVPVPDGSPIASQTVASAHSAGWIWDIGLPTRRGIGCVYSSRHMSDEDANAQLRRYVGQTLPDAALKPDDVRQLAFSSGHRGRFWQGNCLAIGQSAGFMEPLEASAIVMIELSLDMLLDNFPATDGSLSLHAERFNRLFCYRWDRIVDFLKLHYVLSHRAEPYWRDHRDPASTTGSLADLVALWRDQPPSAYDFPQRDEVFPAASHQYVLYGMRGRPENDRTLHTPAGAAMEGTMQQINQRGRALASALPTNRAYLDALRDAEPREAVVAGADR